MSFFLLSHVVITMVREWREYSLSHVAFMLFSVSQQTHLFTAFFFFPSQFSKRTERILEPIPFYCDETSKRRDQPLSQTCQHFISTSLHCYFFVKIERPLKADRSAKIKSDGRYVPKSGNRILRAPRILRESFKVMHLATVVDEHPQIWGL